MIEVVTAFLVSLISNILATIIVDKIRTERDKHEE